MPGCTNTRGMKVTARATRKRPQINHDPMITSPGKAFRTTPSWSSRRNRPFGRHSIVALFLKEMRTEPAARRTGSPSTCMHAWHESTTLIHVSLELSLFFSFSLLFLIFHCFRFFAFFSLSTLSLSFVFLFCDVTCTGVGFRNVTVAEEHCAIRWACPSRMTPFASASALSNPTTCTRGST